MSKHLITIAIDGFSSSGKSTMAKELAKEIGYTYIDSGAMYRATTLYCLQNNLIADGKVDEKKLYTLIPNIEITFCLNPTTGASETCLNGVNVEKEIREMTVSNNVSVVATVPFVRHFLVSLQQKMGVHKGIVMDGRDIGTTVFPDAELKIYVNASPETRAKRRYEEMSAKGLGVSYEEVYKNVCERDYIDQNRAESPLKKADDAIVLDNSSMTIEEQNDWLMAQYNRAIESI